MLVVLSPIADRHLVSNVGVVGITFHNVPTCLAANYSHSDIANNIEGGGRWASAAHAILRHSAGIGA